MKRFYLLTFLFISIFSTSFSQKSLNDYSYIVISEQFEFQKEKDKYELNSFTKFLFNKHGFHAFFINEVPINASRCDGLLAEAEGAPGFIYTRVELVLYDCNGVEVYRSGKGTSKLKDYKKAYYQSMRGAFENIIDLDVHQKQIDNSLVKQETLILSSSTVSITKETINNTRPKNETSVVTKKTVLNIPSGKYTNYSFKNDTFLLRKTKKGYSFYKESKLDDEDLILMGKLVVNESKIDFTDINNTKKKIYFDASNNLIIEDNGSPLLYIKN